MISYKITEQYRNISFKGNQFKVETGFKNLTNLSFETEFKIRQNATKNGFKTQKQPIIFYYS